MGAIRAGRSLTPSLDALAARGTTFKNAIAHSAHTPEGIPAILQSVCAGVRPAAGIGPHALNEGVPTLAEVFKDNGYQTAAMYRSPYLGRALGYARGCDHFEDGVLLSGAVPHTAMLRVQRWLNFASARPYITGPALARRALRWFDSTDPGRPFFAWLHFMDAHGPYQPAAADLAAAWPEERGGSPRGQTALWRRAGRWAPESITEEEQARLGHLYDGAVHGVDRAIGGLVRALDRRGLLDGTVIVVTSDHGEAFGEHGLYDHPNQLFGELLDVPCVLLHPGGDRGRTYDSIVSSLDIAPTLLDAAGLPPVADCQGRSLLQQMAGTASPVAVAISEVIGERADAGLRKLSARSSTHAYEVALRGNLIERERLSDLVEDTGEQFNLVESERGRANELSAVLAAHARRWHPPETLPALWRA